MFMPKASFFNRIGCILSGFLHVARRCPWTTSIAHTQIVRSESSTSPLHLVHKMSTSKRKGASPPLDEPKRRFQPITTPTEWIEDYKPGGFHPVHIGDVFCDSRYQILRKLGYGSFSTVWLGKDRRCGVYVALKILIADKDDVPQNEVTIFELLSKSPIEHPGRAHVITLRDVFEHSGPNGIHRCLVFDLMGPNAETMAEHLPLSITRDASRGPVDRSYPLWMAKSMLRQVLEGIDFMHQNGIAHGDVQPGNVLFALTNLPSAEDEGRLMQNMTTTDPANHVPEVGISEPIRSLDRQADRWAPKYLAINQPLDNYVDLYPPRFLVKLSDLGGSFLLSHPPAEPVTPVGLRSPECICGAPISPTQDMWSFGCLVYQLLTGLPLFTVAGYDSGEEAAADDDHLLQFSCALGPLPRDILSKWSRSPLYYDAEGRLQRHTPLPQDGEEDDDDEDDDPDSLSLEGQFRMYKGSDVGEAEAGVITDLIRSMVQYDARQRPTASELLRHPWFSG